MSCKIEDALKELKAIEGIDAEELGVLKEVLMDMTAKETSLYSDLDGVVDELENFIKVEEQLSSNPEAVLELMSKIREVDPIEVSEEHGVHLEKMVRMFLDPAKKFIPDMNVFINMEASKTGGALQVEAKNIYVGVSKINPITGLHMSGTEVLVHELMHGALEYAFVDNITGAVTAKNKLWELYKQARKVIKWEDLVVKNSNYTKEQEEANAKEMHEYIFGSKAKNPMAEFLAHALTNEQFIKVLGKLDVTKEGKVAPKNFVEQLQQWVEKLLNVVFDIGTGVRKMKMDKAVLKLAIEVANTNNKAVEETKQNIVRKAFTALDEQVNTKLSNSLKKGIEKLQATKYSTTGVKPYDVIRNMPKFLVDDKSQNILRQLADEHMGKWMDYRGSIQSLLKDFMSTKTKARLLEYANLISGQIDPQKQRAEMTYAEAFIRGFKEKPTEMERIAVGLAVVETDASSLREGTDLHKILLDDKALDKEISDSLDKLDVDDETKNMYKYQLKGIGEYMATGRTSIPGVSKNVRNLVVFQGDQNLGNLEVMSHIASLQAIKHTTESARSLAAEMYKKDPDGVWNAMQMHSNLKRESKEMLFNKEGEEAQMEQGYVREVLDADVAIEVAPMYEKERMEANGFKLVKKLVKDKNDSTTVVMGLFVSTSAVKQQYHRQGVRISDKNARGVSLLESHLDQGGISDYRNTRDKALRDIAKQKKEVDEALRQMRNGTYVDSGESKMIPSIDNKGRIVDFRYVMSKMEKAKHLGRDSQANLTLGRSASYIIDKHMSEKMNLEYVDSLVHDMQVNADKSEHKSRYIEFGPESKDELVAEAWQVMPTYLKNALHNKLGKDVNNKQIQLKVDKETFNMYFGNRGLTIDNFPGMHRMPHTVRHLLRLVERIWKDIVAIVKLDIVIKTPAVLVGNVLSNLLLSVMMGMYPWDVAKMQWEGAVSLRKFMANAKKLREMELAEKTGKIVDKAEMNALRKEMDGSPIKPLIDKGLFQAITEDIDLDAIDHKSKTARYFDDIVSKTPQWLQTGTSYAFLTQKSPLYKAMMISTQYSDFVARYGVYNMLIDRYKKEGMTIEQAKDKALNRALDAFINYDLPDSKVIRYMNDIGLVMFTKYLVRIQKVVREGIVENPVQFIGAILGQELIADIDDPTNHSLLVTNPFSALHSPLSTIEEFIKPSGLQAVGLLR